MNRMVRNRSSRGETCRQSRQGKNGFTLTELLVTMAIIALLLGLLIPGIRLVLEWRDYVAEATLYREVALAIWQYAQEHDGLFPKVADPDKASQQFAEALAPYLKHKKLVSKLSTIEWRCGDRAGWSLNFAKQDQILNPGRVPIGGEPLSKLLDKGKIWVIFADGHAERITKEQAPDIFRRPIAVAGGPKPGIPPFDDVSKGNPSE